MSQEPQELQRCPLCRGLRLLPNWSDAPGGPRCACGRPSLHEDGFCGIKHGPIPCPRCGSSALPLTHGLYPLFIKLVATEAELRHNERTLTSARERSEAIRRAIADIRSQLKEIVGDD